jgi:RNA polymerase sigma-70 factor (ECF subfamily)
MSDECGRERGEGDAASVEEAQRVADAQRDPRRFAVLYEANVDEVYAFVSRRVGSRTDAEDLTATVFHKALANLHRFEWRGIPFVAWLMRIAANELADWARQRARPLPEMAAQSTADLDVVERRAALFRSVRALPDDQRRVVALRFAEQWTIKEVAADLGRSVGAVKQLQFRALTTLRAQLGDDARLGDDSG